MVFLKVFIVFSAKILENFDFSWDISTYFLQKTHYSPENGRFERFDVGISEASTGNFQNSITSHQGYYFFIFKNKFTNLTFQDFLSSSAKLSENRVLQATQELCGKLTEKQKVQDDTINLLLSALGQIQENQNKILNQFASMQSQLDIVKRRQDAYERDLIQQKPSVPEQKVGESSKKSPRSAESALKYVETCTKVVDLCIAVSMPGRLFSIGANKMESVEQLKMKIECQTGIPRTKFWLRLHGWFFKLDLFLINVFLIFRQTSLRRQEARRLQMGYQC